MIRLANQLTENKNTQPNLNEGLGDAISKIRNLAIKIADRKAGNAVKHLNLDKISKDKPDGKSAMNTCSEPTFPGLPICKFRSPAPKYPARRSTNSPAP